MTYDPDTFFTTDRIIEFGNHLARAVQQAHKFSLDYAAEGGCEERSSLFAEAAQKLMSPEPWMHGCVAYKIYGVGDGGESLQAEKHQNADVMEYVDLLAKREVVISPDWDRDILVEACVRLSIGYTQTEEEWREAIEGQTEGGS